MNDDDWEVEDCIFDELDEVYSFTLDVAANRKNRKCQEYLGPDHEDPHRRDALTCSWGQNVCWMNPPRDDKIRLWLEKAREEALDGAVTVFLLGGPPSVLASVAKAYKATYAIIAPPIADPLAQNSDSDEDWRAVILFGSETILQAIPSEPHRES